MLEKIKRFFHNLIYPTKYVIEIGKDGVPRSYGCGAVVKKTAEKDSMLIRIPLVPVAQKGLVTGSSVGQARKEIEQQLYDDRKMPEED